MHTWQDGEVITAEKLNEGVSSKIIIASITDIHASVDDGSITGTCNYTYQELKNYINNGYWVMFYSDMAGSTDPAKISNDEIEASKLIYVRPSFSIMTIMYTEEGLTIEQTLINNN